MFLNEKNEEYRHEEYGKLIKTGFKPNNYKCSCSSKDMNV